MNKYRKIQTVYKRTQRGELIIGDWSCEEFAYLRNNHWLATEKIDGTNIRIMWENKRIRFGGKTDNAQIQTDLYDYLARSCSPETFESIFPDTDACLYGEGYGAKINNGGDYIPKSYQVLESERVGFALFEVKIDHWWLKWEDVCEIARKLGKATVPCLGIMNLADAIDMTRDGFVSAIGDREAEGMVLRPIIDLLDRGGQPIRAKIKTKDFKKIAQGKERK